jgi:hypothetical protein
MTLGARYPDFPPLEGEDLFTYTERYLKSRGQFRPWEQPAIEPPKEQPRMPYVDREPGSDDE